MHFPLQPTLQNETIKIQPLQQSDFETLYAIASDPLIWEQHPSWDRYKRDVFEKFFALAMESGGAFLVLDNKTGEAIGSSRYYDLIPEKNSVVIGYTFLARKYWGSTYNHPLKKLMLDYAFRFVDHVIFHIGPSNIRSQTAIGKIGAKRISEAEIPLYGESKEDSVVHVVSKNDWQNR